jgi:hypothetical protein
MKPRQKPATEQNTTLQEVNMDLAMKMAMNICHDLHEGYVPGCGRCLSLADMEKAREAIAAIIRLTEVADKVGIPTSAYGF